MYVGEQHRNRPLSARSGQLECRFHPDPAEVLVRRLDIPPIASRAENGQHLREMHLVHKLGLRHFGLLFVKRACDANTCATRGIRQNAAMSVTRIAWLATVLAALITALLLLLAGYYGYAGLGVAVAASAAINLF